MENKETATENEHKESSEEAKAPVEATKTKDMVEDKPSITDATEPESSEEKKPTQNGELEHKVIEDEEGSKPVESSAVETSAEPVNQTPDPPIVASKPDDTNKHEEKPARSTRGTKRKANDIDKNDTIESISSETAEQKENMNSKNNDNVPTATELRDEPPIKSLSSSNVMGKGKRARIPNKRYSDILMSPNRKSIGQKSFDITEPEVSIQVKEEPIDSPAIGTISSPSLPSKKGRASLPKENLQDTKYQKPFKYGWKRELVWRSTSTQSKRLGDIYYYTPTGKKVRSFREVSDHLNNKNLSLDNFSFTKEPLGVNDSEKEIIRYAKVGKSSESFSDTTTPTPKKLEIKKPKKILSPKTGGTETSKAAAEPVVATPGRKRTAAASVAAVVEKEKNTAKETPSPNKKITKMPLKKGKTPLAKKPKLSNKSDESMEVDTTPPIRTSPTKTSKLCQPCSIRCDGLQGIVPTLQCRVCLCLYHHICVGVSPNLVFPYVCKNCHEQVQETSQSSSIVSPPPLTPINTLKSVSTSMPTTTLPKLQRIPRPDSADPPTLLKPPPLVEGNKIPNNSVMVGEMPTLTPKPSQLQEGGGEACKSLVGSVTSWLPHNAKIINQTQTETPRPQYVEYLAGRKFLVIPKHNFMSVSSTSQGGEDSIITPPLQPTEVPISSASMGPSSSSSAPNTPQEAHLSPKLPAEATENAPDIKKEPLSPERAGEPSDIMEVDGVEPKQEKCDEEEEHGAIDNVSSQNAVPSPQQKVKKRNLKLKSITNSNSAVPEEKNEAKFMENYLQNLSFGYNTLLYVFQYLKVQDLLRAGCVCTMWRDIASHPILWRTVRMKNSQVHSFEGLANTLKKHGTVHLDLRKMLLPSNGDDIWPEFSKAIARVDTLRKIELCRCPASVVEQLAVSNTSLEVINAVTIKCDSMNLDSFSSLTSIKELRLKSTSGLNVNSIDSLKQLKSLRILSLTSVNDLYKLDLSVIAELANLESLDLGECTEFPNDFGKNILVKLTKLEKLRLEKGQGNCHTFEILEAVKDMKSLEQLELVNFDVKAGFDKALGVCTNIRKLMIIPTYISQSATTNNMVLAGVLRLQGSLTHFVWGVTLELLRVTELFVDQCEDSNKKDKKPTGTGDSIPVLKPVPDLSNGGAIQAASNPPQVEILPLPNLQKLLLNSLPTTRVKILKIPFHATWRQTLTDSV